MIDADQIVEALRNNGFHACWSVPCSYLTSLIDCCIRDEGIEHYAAANEGDAVASAAGYVVGGRRAFAMMQNSGLGNAVNPLTSLTHTFRIPILLIVTLRGDPQLEDEPQHELMGNMTTDLLSLLRIGWEYFPEDAEELAPAFSRATRCFRDQSRPYALVVRKGTIAPVAAKAPARKAQPTQCSSTCDIISRRDIQEAGRVSRTRALRVIIDRTPPHDSVIVSTTGHTSRELFALDDRANHLYIVGSLGCASSFALGLALARSDLHVVVIDGDGAALMRLGNLPAIGAYGGSNLTHILLDNQSHASTGGQATVSGQVSFARIAAACGYRSSYEGDGLDLLEAVFADARADGPRFAHIRISNDSPANLPRPSMAPDQVCRRFMAHIGSKLAHAGRM